MTSIEDEPIWDSNARSVAEKNFPGIDFDSLYYIAELLPKKCKRRNKIKVKAQTMENAWRASGFERWYYKISPNNYVFVVVLPETIISVFQI